MKIIRQTPFEVGVTPIQIQAEPTRNVVVVKATLKLGEKGLCHLAEVQSPCSGPVFLDDDPEASLLRHNDYAPLKRQAEYLLVGTCRSDNGAPVTHQAISLRVGDLSKELSVFGDRYWRHGLAAMKPSEPIPFVEMPLSWEKAFGGHGFEANPVGQGLHKVKVGESERTMLPNIEERTDLVTSPHSRPQPRGTFPLSPTWRMRTRLAGTYDKHYVENHYPGMPADLDPAYFQSAPSDQRQDEFWNGTERISMSGVTSGGSVYETTLPGLRARAFEASGLSADATLRELTLNLDTLYIDTTNMIVELTWRGACALEPELLYFMHDNLKAPMSLQACERKFRKRVEAIEAGEASFLPDPIPAAPEEATPDYQETMTTAAITSADLRPASLDDEAFDADLATQALPRIVDPSDASEESDEMPTMMLPSISDVDDNEMMQTQALPRIQDLDEEMATQTVPTLSAVPDDSAQTATEAEPSILDQVKAMMVERGLDPSTLPDGPENMPAAPTASDIDFAKLRVSAAAAGLMNIPEAKAMIDEMERDHEALQNQETTRQPAITADEVISDPRTDFIQQYKDGNPIEGDFTGINLDGVHLSGLQAQGATLIGISFAGANLSEAEFGEAQLDDCNFQGANLTNANFDGAQLTQANLSNAQAEGASFKSAELVEANLQEANLTKADLSGAECGQVNLRGAILTEAICDEADFGGAVLERVSALRSSWIEARLSGVHAEAIDLRDADLSNLRVSNGATLIRAKMSGSKAPGSRWRDSRLAEAVFSFSDLNGAIFTGSHLAKVYMDGCDLKKANFQDTVLSEAQLLRSDLMQATFRGANLVDADLRGSNLYECEFFRAITLGANFALADLTGTRLENQ